MSVAIKKRSITIKNTLVFIIFSFFYTYIISSISGGETAIDLNKLINFIKVNYIQAGVGILSFISIYLFWRFKEYIFVLYCTILNITVFSYFYASFDKLILIFNFCFLIISYSFYLLLKAEKDEAIYDPRFKTHFLGRKCEYELPCEVFVRDKSYQGYLTNWDSLGVFVNFDSDEKYSLSGKVDLHFKFGKHDFRNGGVVRTTYGNGYGISILKAEDELNWKKLYNLLRDRGFKPRYT